MRAAASVTPIDVASNTPGAEIKVGSEPFGIAITPAPQCTSAIGRGTYLKRGETGRLNITNELTTNGASHKLLVNSETGAVRFRLLSLPSASCVGAAGSRVFHGEGTAAKGTEKGYTMSFTLTEEAGKFYFEAKLKKGTFTEQEPKSGAFTKTTESIF